MSLLATQALHITIGKTTVCSDLEITINSGERWCVLGRNGTGKTTLLHTLAGLRPPDAGNITLNDQPLSHLSRKSVAQHLGLLFQDHTDAFPASVLETVLTGRHPWLGPLQWESNQDLVIAKNALHAVDLCNMEERMVNTLSGGERRRAGIACLLTQEPQLLLLDEPTNHLDIHHQISMLNLLQEHITQNGKALLLVMHDLNLAVRYCNRFLLLFGDGETVQGTADTVLTQTNLERLYQHPLLAVAGPHGTVWLPQ
ncbi:MAG: ABC transporter ATP-binding protein [Gammaproteobacteria bacterium]|jgi:iron complex transport system ATP-binding protein|nr:ABC transporter ATP-binding protein [Gammaproteobacteria bacterium]